MAIRENIVASRDRIEHVEAWMAGRKRNIIANARKTWMANTPRALEIVDATEAGRIYNNGNVSYKEGFIGSMASALDKFGKLTPKQSEAVLKGIDTRAAKKAEWASERAALNANRAHIGAVGDKVTMTLTICHIVVLEGIYGSTFIYIMEDADGNVVIYKGNSPVISWTPDGTVRAKGNTLTISATIKEHGVRDGVKQTVIQRPKAVEVALG